MTTSNSTQTSLPKWFWAVAIFFLLWNIMGLLSFFGHTFITEEALAKMPENEQALFGEYPIWTTIVFAIATFAGLIGCIGLIMKKKWAKMMFVVSFIAIILQMTHNVFFTSSIEVYGMIQAITMPILVVVFGGILIWFSNYAIGKNWLN